MTASAVRRPRPDEAELIDRAVDGDRAAFRELYRQHAGAVLRLVTRIMGPTADRDDVVQEVFLALHRALPTFRGGAALSTLIYRLTVHKTADHLKRTRRRARAAFDPEAVVDLIDPRITPAQQSLQRRELERMFDALSRLRPRQRLAFALVAIEGHSLVDAARYLDSTPQAVKQRVLRARRVIARRLGLELAGRWEGP